MITSGVKSLSMVAILVAGLLAFFTGSTAVAEGLQFASGTAFAGVPQPIISKGKGDACIAPTDFMRRNHMNMLKHDRDEAVHLGNREIKASLKECVSCHAVNGADNQPVTVEDPKHFCRSCHDYVAVKIDCFECHASRPELKLKSKLDTTSPEAEALASYVKGSDE